MILGPESRAATAAAWWLMGAVAASTGLAPARAAAEVSIEVHDLECMPKEENSVGFADVRGMRLGDAARLYFRRLHHLTEDFYYVPMTSLGEQRYLAVLPKPHDRRLKRTELRDVSSEIEETTAWARWWQAKDASEDRDPSGDLDADRIERYASVGGKSQPQQRVWMQSATGEALQAWLEALENEPVEYYGAVVDASGELLARTEFRRTVVTRECPSLDLESVRRALPEAWARELGEPELARMTSAILGRTEVLTVGETAPWQRGESVFHWKCDGIVNRIDPDGVHRPDEVCRACVFIVPLWLVGVTSAAGTVPFLDIVDPPLASPTTP